MPRASRLFWAIALAVPLLSAHAQPHADRHSQLTILADTSLAIPLRQAAKAYAQYEQQVVTVIVDAPSRLSARVSEGLAADLVITADDATKENLKLRGERDEFASRDVYLDPLVLVSSAESFGLAPRTGEVWQHLLSANGEVATFFLYAPKGDSRMRRINRAVPHAGFDPAPEIQTRTTLESVANALEKHSGFSVLPASLARQHSQQFRVVSTLPLNRSTPHYFAAVLAGEQMHEARKFVTFLEQDLTQHFFREAGFSPVN